MMTQLFLTISMMAIISMDQTKSPMSMCIALTLTSGLNFMLLSFVNSSSIMSVIIMMIFLGGIIMMFMILCSIMPNSPFKSKKEKKLMFTMATATMVYMCFTPQTSTTMQESSLKWFLETSNNTLMVMVIMIVYFILFNKCVMKTKKSMRTLEC